MTTWFAQNSSVNIDSVNQWNDAANGSGNWLTWANLGASDVLCANGKTSIRCSVNFTCSEIRTLAIGAGVSGGGFYIDSSRIITANILAGTTNCLSHLDYSGAGSTIVGSVTGSAANSVRGIVHSSIASLIVTGDVTAGSGNGMYLIGTGPVTVNGTVTGGSSDGIQNYLTNGALLVNGNVISTGVGFGIWQAGNGPLTINGNLLSGNSVGVYYSTNHLTVNGNISNDSIGGSALSNHTMPTTITGNVSGNVGHGVLVGAGDMTVIGNITGGANSNAAGVSIGSSTGILTIIGDVVGGLGGHGIVSNSYTKTLVVTGNITGGIYGGYSINGIYNNGNGSVTVNGNVVGGSSALSHGINNYQNSPVFTVVGNVTGGSHTSAYGVWNAGTGAVTIIGDIIASLTTQGYSYGDTNHTLIHSGGLVGAANGKFPLYVAPTYLVSPSAVMTARYRVNSGGVAGAETRFLSTAGGDNPTVNNVRLGIVYNGMTGTLAVPDPAYVSIGIATDNTVGSYSPSVNASDIRTAVGLASANLDTQLSGIQSNADDIKAKTDNLPADPADQSAVEAAITAATSGLATELTAAAILEYTGTTIPALISDILTDVATADDLALLKAVTDKIATVIYGTLSGANTNTEVFVGDGYTVTVTVDSDGNRSNVEVT